MKERHRYRRSGPAAIGLSLVIVALAAGCRSEEPPAPTVLDPISREYLMASDEMLRQHQFPLALALVDSVEQRAPGAPDAAFLRGRIYSEMLRWEDAETAYRDVLARDPDYPGVWNNLGNNAARQFEYRRAIALYRKELEVQPAPIPWRGIGRAYRELGVVDSARMAFEQALALDSTYASAHESMAQLLEDDGAFEEALAHAQRALALQPDGADAHYLVGTLLMRVGRPEAAVPHLQRVVEAWPWHHGAHFNLGQALLRLGRSDEGQHLVARAEQLRERQARVDYMEQTVRNTPDDPYAHAGFASALRLAGRYNDAMHAYQVALTMAPDNLEFQNNVAALHLLREDTTEAIQTYLRILKQDPTLVEVWLNVGILYAISGETSNARRAWQNALRYQPDNPAAQAYLARLEREAPER